MRWVFFIFSWCSSVRRKGRSQLIEWAHTRLSRIAFIFIVVSFMTACAPATEDRRAPEAHDAARKSKNEIPEIAATILEQADHFELLSLNPQPNENVAESDFHGYKVLGVAVIRDAETRKNLVSVFETAVAENEGIMAACFNPRHGIRVTRNRQHADFVICFECAQVHVTGEVQGEFLITNSAEALFDTVLRTRGLPRAGK
jgi:hypothetical protein